MVFAADYPFMDVLWTMVIFFLFVAWIWTLVVILADVFRRSDIGGWSKAGWTAFLIVLPWLGALTYLIVNSSGMATRAAGQATVSQRGYDYGHSSAGNGGPAAEIAKAKELLDGGAISQVEFEAIKAKAIA